MGFIRPGRARRSRPTSIVRRIALHKPASRTVQIREGNQVVIHGGDIARPRSGEARVRGQQFGQVGGTLLVALLSDSQGLLRVFNALAGDIQPFPCFTSLDGGSGEVEPEVAGRLFRIGLSGPLPCAGPETAAPRRKPSKNSISAATPTM